MKYLIVGSVIEKLILSKNMTSLLLYAINLLVSSFSKVSFSKKIGVFDKNSVVLDKKTAGKTNLLFDFMKLLGNVQNIYKIKLKWFQHPLPNTPHVDRVKHCILMSVFFLSTVTGILLRSCSQYNVRSSHPEVLCEEVVLKKFAKFTGKHQCRREYFNKIAGR